MISTISMTSMLVMMLVGFHQVHQVHGAKDIDATWKCTSWSDLGRCTDATITGTIKSQAANCFPGSAQVWRVSPQHADSNSSLDASISAVNMSDLKVGDMVLTALVGSVVNDTLEYVTTVDTVYAFLDRHAYSFASHMQCITMLRLSFSFDLEHGSTEVTPDHMIYRITSGDFVPARNLTVGDFIMHVDQKSGNVTRRAVTAIGKLCVETDYYAPVTYSGTILVDGVWYSNYVQLPGHDYSHETAHASLAPLRLYYSSLVRNRITADINADTYVNGVHPYAKLLMTMLDRF